MCLIAHLLLSLVSLLMLLLLYSLSAAHQERLFHFLLLLDESAAAAAIGQKAVFAPIAIDVLAPSDVATLDHLQDPLPGTAATSGDAAEGAVGNASSVTIAVTS